jgi:polysaccharide export outer membrane protein
MHSGTRCQQVLTISAALVLCCLAGCADLGPYTWVNDYTDAVAPADGYVIANGDVLQVRVFNQDNLSTKAKVRSDGRISLPLLNDVVAAGYTPSVLGQQLETRLKDFIKLPVVTVSVEESRPVSVLVAGEVPKQGTVALDANAGVLTALLAAGGLSDFAHRDRIFVVRPQPNATPVRIRFSWKELLRAQDKSASFKLRADDMVVVE